MESWRSTHGDIGAKGGGQHWVSYSSGVVSMQRQDTSTDSAKYRESVIVSRTAGSAKDIRTVEYCCDM